MRTEFTDLNDAQHMLLTLSRYPCKLCTQPAGVFMVSSIKTLTTPSTRCMVINRRGETWFERSPGTS